MQKKKTIEQVLDVVPTKYCYVEIGKRKDGTWLAFDHKGNKMLNAKTERGLVSVILKDESFKQTKVFLFSAVTPTTQSIERLLAFTDNKASIKYSLRNFDAGYCIQKNQTA